MHSLARHGDKITNHDCDFEFVDRGPTIDLVGLPPHWKSVSNVNPVFVFNNGPGWFVWSPNSNNKLQPIVGEGAFDRAIEIAASMVFERTRIMIFAEEQLKKSLHF